MTVVTDPPDQPTLTRGHKKKARTRGLLLDTALEVVAERGEAFSVSDIVERAGVSQGTFYNYFADREQLVAALVPAIVDRFAAAAAASVEHPDPAHRFALITARALARADAAPDVVRVALRLEPVQQALIAGGPFAYLLQDLADGYAAGRFTEPPDDATLDVVVGSILMAARRLVDDGGHDDEQGRGYRRAVLRHLLQALGVDSTEAATIAAEAVAAAG
jgi:AcrR family transcriptional regulator